MTTLSDLQQNQLLRALPEAVARGWLPHLESVALLAGRVLHEPRDRLGHLWFPTTASVSLLHTSKEGASTEIALIGREGLVGMELFMDGTALPGQAVVQAAGHALRLRGGAAREEFSRSAEVMHLMLCSMQALITQIAQTAFCGRHHSLLQRLSRRLLMGVDRSDGDELKITQEQLAHLLGVRREGVSECELRLQGLELIRYARGYVRVLNITGLESEACECYRVVKNEYERLLPRREGYRARSERRADLALQR